MRGLRLDVERLAAAWSRAEFAGLQLAGLALASVGLSLLTASVRGTPEFRLLVGGAGVVLALAGALAALRLREDVVTGAAAGIATAWLAVVLVVISPTTSAQDVANDLLVPAVIGCLALAVRVFRGGFRAQRRGANVR